MAGVGLQELALIAFIAVFVFGPDRLPDYARMAGRFLYQAKLMATSARDDLRKELGPEFADLELTDLDPRKIVRKHVIDAMNEVDRESAQKGHSKKDVPLPADALPPYDDDAT